MFSFVLCCPVLFFVLFLCSVLVFFLFVFWFDLHCFCIALVWFGLSCCVALAFGFVSVYLLLTLVSGACSCENFWCCFDFVVVLFWFVCFWLLFVLKVVLRLFCVMLLLLFGYGLVFVLYCVCVCVLFACKPLYCVLVCLFVSA